MGPVPRGSAIHVDAKMTMEKAGAPSKDYGASFSGAYGTDGTKLAVNAQLELPLSQVSDPFTVCYLLDLSFFYVIMTLYLSYEHLSSALKAEGNTLASNH